MTMAARSDRSAGSPKRVRTLPPRVRWARQRPSARTTRAPAALAGRALGCSGQGSTLPYGLAGSRAARTTGAGWRAPEGHSVRSGESAKERT